MTEQTKANPEYKHVVVLRHGQKDGDALTERGIAQITALGSFLRQLGFVFVQAYWSGAQRTLETVNAALDACGQPIAEPIEDIRAGMEDLLAADPAGFMAKFKQAGADIKEACGDASPTAADYLTHWPTAAVLKARLETLMQDAIAGIDPGEAVLIGSHGPTAELAVLSPESCQALAEGEAVVYGFDKDHNLVESYRIRTPIE